MRSQVSCRATICEMCTGCVPATGVYFINIATPRCLLDLKMAATLNTTYAHPYKNIWCCIFYIFDIFVLFTVVRLSWVYDLVLLRISHNRSYMKFVANHPFSVTMCTFVLVMLLLKINYLDRLLEAISLDLVFIGKCKACYWPTPDTIFHVDENYCLFSAIRCLII